MEAALAMSRVASRAWEQLYLQRTIQSIARSPKVSSPRSAYSHPHPSPFLQHPRASLRSSYICYRCLHTTRTLDTSKPPKSRDRGPASKETTQTDFGALNVLGNTPPPTTAIDACTLTGFALNSNIKISNSGVLLIGGEAFLWRPWLHPEPTGARDPSNVKDIMSGTLLNARGQWEVGSQAWGVLDLVWPKPDLLILGTGKHIVPLSPGTRKAINELGIRVEVADTRNAAAQYNLLATERGVEQVAAALVPVG